MISQKLFRHIYCKRASMLNLKCISQSYSQDSSSSSSSSDDEKDKKKIKQQKNVKAEQSKKSEDALKKLNMLLKTMVDEDKQQPVKSTLDLAKPKSRVKVKIEKEKKPEDIITVTKKVADSLGGDKQIESELLSKLLGVSVTKDSSEAEKKPMNLSEVLVGMKIDRTPPSSSGEEISKAKRVKKMLSDVPTQHTKSKAPLRSRRPQLMEQSEMEKVNLFGSDPIGIFTKESFKPVEKQIELKTWNKLLERELQLTVTHPPENYFQEMILWTKQGKIWKFPIDNEQGMEEEQNVSFTEHIFLEKHLEPWCPTKGPIRHFMELVCVGLSKNPYLTVQAKKDHIEWFKNYFSSKLDILSEVGAIPADFEGLKQLKS